MRVSALRPATAQRLLRLLRYCARPPFAMDRLCKEGAALVYRCAKQHSESAGDKRGAKVDEIQTMKTDTGHCSLMQCPHVFAYGVS